VTQEELRGYIGALSFLLAALAFFANERREAIKAMEERSDVGRVEKGLTTGSILVLMLATAALAVSAVPVLEATNLSISKLFRLETALEQAFALGWLMLIAMAVSFLALLIRACQVKR
jgi:hypothetical protein